jgi:flagellar motor protein MotB
MMLSVSAFWPATAPAQLGGLRQKAEEAKRKLDDAAKKSAADSAKAKSDSSKTATSAKPAAPQASASSPATPVSAKVWENYDFVPGSKVIFYTDFSDDRVGNAARGLKYRSGPVEVVERDGVKMLRATGKSEMLIPVGKKLPERFTLEIDVIGPPSGINEMVSVEGGVQMDRGATSGNLIWNPTLTWIEGSGMNGANSTVKLPDAVVPTIMGKVAHLRILMDSGYLKMYVNEHRMYNRPDFAFRRDSVIRLLVWGKEDEGMATYITSVRVAESETDVLYDALLAKGRWTTHGILFATGKAELQPESRAVLKDIAATMKKYADLRILVEGHTDNVGSAESNLALSDARAAAVKAALVADHGVDAARLTTKGFGDTKPSAPNATAAGRAQNRRVEIVKQ